MFKYHYLKVYYCQIFIIKIVTIWFVKFSEFLKLLAGHLLVHFNLQQKSNLFNT